MDAADFFVLQTGSAQGVIGISVEQINGRKIEDALEYFHKILPVL